MNEKLTRFINGLLPELIRIRHYIHQNPEFAYEEVGTAALVERELRGLGIEITRIGKTGVVGLLRGGRRGGKVVALRADMDALRIREETGLPYASTNGCMHACGHDGHTTVLLGAAKVLAAMRDELRGSVKFIFQPAEESASGGKVMCDGGALQAPRPDAIFALHGFPEVPLGSVAVSPGIAMAACDSVFITVRGRGGHGARPDTTVDPIIAAARVIEALQSIVSREIAPSEPAVISICSIKGGATVNVIPDVVEMSGTIRCTGEQTRQKLFAAIRRVAGKTAAAHGAKATVRFAEGYPATINDEAMTRVLQASAAAVLGENNVLPMGPLAMVAEDFSFYLQRVPGCYFRLGLREKGKPQMALHNSKFNFPDKAIGVGVRVMTQVVRDFIA